MGSALRCAMTTAIPVLSLLVAVLAVLFGPVVTWRVARRQLSTNLEVSNKQIIAPMRQAWINNLRDLLSEITSSSLHYHVAGFEERTDEEYQHLTYLEYKIKLMLNPREEDHEKLEKLIGEMTCMLAKRGSMELDAQFESCHKAVVSLSRDVLKREWDRVKDRIQPA
jgi:hypothetical protein